MILCLINNLYFFDVNKKTIILRKQRKTYFTDPFLYYRVFKGYSAGKYEDYSTDVQDKLVEGIVLEHLARTDKYKESENFLGYYCGKKETDFVFCKDQRIGIEVKWQNKVDFDDLNSKFLFI